MSLRTIRTLSGRCLVILTRSRDGIRAVYAWSLVALASAVSIALNVAHAPAHTAARLVAALPPAALLAALELVMSEARRLRNQASAETTAQPALRPLSSRDLVRDLLSREPAANVDQVIELTEVSRRRAYEPLAQVRAEGNGDGHRGGEAIETT